MIRSLRQSLPCQRAFRAASTAVSSLGGGGAIAGAVPLSQFPPPPRLPVLTAAATTACYTTKKKEKTITSAEKAAAKAAARAAAEAAKPQPSRFAVIDHSSAYEAAMGGRQGKQLSLAYQEGIGKDDAPFDLDDWEHLEAMAMEKYLAEEKEDDNEVIEATATEVEKPEKQQNEEGKDDEDDDTKDGSEEEYDAPLSFYNRDGSVKWSKGELAALRAGAPAGGNFAVIDVGTRQFKVTTDDVLIVNKLRPTDLYKVGSVHTFTDNLLLLGNSHFTLIGMPRVTAPGAYVKVLVEEITKDHKITVFKKRRRQGGSKTKQGFRREVTFLRILEIGLPQDHVQTEAPSRERPSPGDVKEIIDLRQSGKKNVLKSVEGAQ